MVARQRFLTDDKLDAYIKLFRGRGDVYGSWAGGCVKKPLTPDTFFGHLQGDELIGVYPLFPYKDRWFCVWGCSDIDVDDLDAARNLQTAFAFKGVTAWVEKTRKGYHVWVFSSTLVQASVMRRAFLAAHQAIDYPAKEVNPKQESARGGYGNYVRLPYPGIVLGWPSERYMLQLESDEPLKFDDFLTQATATMTDDSKLEELANLWKAPTPRRVISDAAPPPELADVLKKVGPIPYVIWRDGPLEGRDRSSTLFRLSCVVRDRGITPDEAFTLLKSADSRWGKFYLRPDGDSEIIKIIERSYNIIWGLKDE